VTLPASLAIFLFNKKKNRLSAKRNLLYENACLGQKATFHRGRETKTNKKPVQPLK